MTDFDDSFLLNVAITIADGLPVDWDTLCEVHPTLVDDLDGLRLLEMVSRSWRQEPGAGDGPFR